MRTATAEGDSIWVAISRQMLRRLVVWASADFCHITLGAPTAPFWHSQGWLEPGRYDLHKTQQSGSLCSIDVRSQHDEMALEDSPKPAKKCQKVPLVRRR